MTPATTRCPRCDGPREHQNEPCRSMTAPDPFHFSDAIEPAPPDATKPAGGETTRDDEASLLRVIAGIRAGRGSWETLLANLLNNFGSAASVGSGFPWARQACDIVIHEMAKDAHPAPRDETTREGVVLWLFPSAASGLPYWCEAAGERPTRAVEYVALPRAAHDEREREVAALRSANHELRSDLAETLKALDSWKARAEKAERGGEGG